MGQRKTFWVHVSTDTKESCVQTANQVTLGQMLTSNAQFALIHFRMLLDYLAFLFWEWQLLRY